MKVYEVRVCGGEYDWAFDYTYRIYDDLGKAIKFCRRLAKSIEERKEDFKLEVMAYPEDVEKIYIDEWEIGSKKHTFYIYKWQRRNCREKFDEEVLIATFKKGTFKKGE